MVVVAPDPQWVKQLPNGKLPDRTDFPRYGVDLASRMKAWGAAASASQKLADEFAEMGYKGPQALGGSPVSLMIYFEDVDTVFNRAVEAGASVKEAVQDKFYGDRTGTLTDPFGHVWHVSTHKEDVSMEEMEKRAKAAGAKASGVGQ